MIPVWARSYLLISFLALFLVMIILDQEPGWNIVLLMGFSIIGGMLLNWSEADALRWATWLTFLGLSGLAMTGSVIFGGVLQKWLKFLLPLTAVYLLVWVGILICDLPDGISGALILTGLILFTISTASTMQRGFFLKKEESSVSLSIELWVTLLNLFWLCGLL